MPSFAQVTGPVSFTPGDGVPMAIPPARDWADRACVNCWVESWSLAVPACA